MPNGFFRTLGLLPPWILTAITVLVILWLTLVPDPMPDIEMPLWEHTDKVVHALMFGGLFFVISLDWYRRHPEIRPIISSSVFPSAFSWSALLGATIELVQPYVGRGNDIWDFVADIAGILLFWLITPPLLKSLKKL